MKRSTAHFESGSNLTTWAMSSILVVMVLLFLAAALSQNESSKARTEDDVRIYCAAGIANTVQEIVDQFNSQHGTRARIERIGGSGELAGQIKSELEFHISGGADIFISNDEQLIVSKEFSKCFQASFPLAQQMPVIAAAAGSRPNALNLSEVIENRETKFGVASERAAVGKLTRQIALGLGLLESLERNKSLDAENVMVLAQALAIGSLDTAIIWDTTVMQVNEGQGTDILKIVAMADQSNASTSSTVVGLIGNSQTPMKRRKQAKDFANFLKGEQAERILLSAGYTLASRPKLPRKQKEISERPGDNE